MQKIGLKRVSPTALNSSTYLVVLVRRDRNERCFREHMGAEGGVFGAEPVIFIRLYNVDPRLIFMHRVQNDLKGRKKLKKKKKRFTSLYFPKMQYLDILVFIWLLCFDFLWPVGNRRPALFCGMARRHRDAAHSVELEPSTQS